MPKARNFLLLLITTIILAVIFVQILSLYIPYKNIFANKDDLRIYLSLVNIRINSVSAEPSNKVYLKVEVKNKNGIRLPGIKVILSIGNNNGSIYPGSSFTDKSGECIVVYTPPNYYSSACKIDPSANITARIANTNVENSLSFKLTPVPVVLVHGYQQKSDIFDNMSEYLEEKGFNCSSIDYDSSLGISYGAEKLEDYLKEQRELFLQQGVLVNRFTLITHSMGGLVARYYTTSEEYVKNDDVNKIIFLSVPHKGSYIASIGENYFKDKSIEDLIPESRIFINSFPDMINKGLNSSIQAGNIFSQYDEVVTAESASLDEWSIKTEVFNLGENNFTVDSILNGSIMEAPNHKSVLNNRKVFDRILEMLNTDLPYPEIRR